ncbi:hypothetical protein ACHAQA_003701 [Verticillium albo-atrum]
MTYTKRARAPVVDLPGGIPFVPLFDEESQIDAAAEASSFISRLATTVGQQDWDGFGQLFHDDVAWWRDALTLTFDKRTIRGKSGIVRAWETLNLKRKPTSFGTEGNEKLGLQAMWLRLAPQLATLDVPFTFQTENPGTECFGLAKLVPVEENGARTYKIWILVTGAAALVERPFENLPRQRPSLIDISQRGKAEAHGLPNLQENDVLDAVVVGASMNGISNSIMLDAAGANFAAFESHSVVGGNWAARYHGVTLHHCAAMIQFPQFPVPADDGYPEYLTGPEISRYCSAAVERLKLPVFAGVRVQSSSYDKVAKLWRVRVQDVASGEENQLLARNLVISTGWTVNSDNIHIPALENRELFKGPVQHTEEYHTSEPYRGKKVVVIGSGNSAHDVAKDLALNGAASVTLLQRSPTILFDFDAVAPVVETPYRLSPSVDAADVVSGALPTAVMRDMMGGLMAMKIQEAEERNQQLEAKGYMVARQVEFVSRAFEERGRSFYFDQPRTFELVFEDRIKIARGEAQTFVENGLKVKDLQTGEETVVEAEGVVFATGYKTIDLPGKYREQGFLEADVTDHLENLCQMGVDVEGEMPGLVTFSGHPHLYFSGFGLYFSRWMARYTAIQVIADVIGEFPERYTRDV